MCIDVRIVDSRQSNRARRRKHNGNTNDSPGHGNHGIKVLELDDRRRNGRKADSERANDGTNKERERNEGAVGMTRNPPRQNKDGCQDGGHEGGVDAANDVSKVPKD